MACPPFFRGRVGETYVTVGELTKVRSPGNQGDIFLKVVLGLWC